MYIYIYISFEKMTGGGPAAHGPPAPDPGAHVPPRAPAGRRPGLRPRRRGAAVAPTLIWRGRRLSAREAPLFLCEPLPRI